MGEGTVSEESNLTSDGKAANSLQETDQDSTCSSSNWNDNVQS